MHDDNKTPEFLLELPVEWMTSKISREAKQSTEIYCQLVTALTEMGHTVKTTPAVMYSDASPRLPADGDICISFHSYGDERNVWRVKESYLPGYFTFDRYGYSGFSELGRFPDRFSKMISTFDQAQADKIVTEARERFVGARVSKYTQVTVGAETLPSRYVFMPLQTEHDAVQQLSDVSQVVAIKKLAEAAEASSSHLVIKRHPFCESADIEWAVAQAVDGSDFVHSSTATIHDLFKGSTAVVGANSGVLFEALVAGLKVYSYADSDFAIATHRMSPPLDFLVPFNSDATTPSTSEINRFLAWYLTDYCIRLDALDHSKRKIQEILDTLQMAPSNAGDERHRLDAKKIVAELEINRRTNASLTEAVFTDAAERMLRKWLYFRPVSYIAKLMGRNALEAGKVWRSLPSAKRNALSSDYYEDIHRSEASYQQNNWLVEYLDVILRQHPRSLLEVGCGNGKFLAEAARYVPHVTGADWAETSTLPLELDNVSFQKTDLTKDALPKAEVVCSADVLEHIPPKDIEAVIDKLFGASPNQFHVIACYDDSHSHLSVFDPGIWLALFRRKAPHARFYEIKARESDPNRLICVITTLSIIQKGKLLPICIRPELPPVSPIRLDLGAASKRVPGYLSVDVRVDSQADIIADITNLPESFFGKVDEIRCRHALEHLSRSDARMALKNWKSVLVEGGKLKLIVPDLEFHARQYLGEVSSTFADQNEHALAGFYGWADPNRGGNEWDIHRWGYSYSELKSLLLEIGYQNVERVVAGDDSEPWHLKITCIK